MSSILSINDLDYVAEPKLIFSANTPTSKGLSNKSYSITLPKTSKNNRLLLNIFGSAMNKPSKIQATYTLNGVLLTGWLKFIDVTEQQATGIFVSGNGSLWAAMEGTQMRSIDMSENDVVLNKTNVLASETGNPFVCFDLTDRGAFKDSNSIDISDRYPALNLSQLLTKTFNAFDTGLTIEGLQGNEYLLFMQENEIRNSKEWKQDAEVEAQVVSDITHSETDVPAITEFNIFESLEFPIEVIDKGGNYNHVTHAYTVPEDGTYSFIYEYLLLYTNFNSNSIISGATSEITLRNGATILAKQIIDVSTLTDAGTALQRQGKFNSYPIELKKDDVIKLYIEFSGYITTLGVKDWTVSVIQRAATIPVNRYYVKPSMWYGAGSTVQMSSILPDMGVLDFIKATAAYLNADIFYDERIGVATFRVGGYSGVSTDVEVWDHASSIEEPKNTLVELSTDKVQPPANYFVNVGGGADRNLKLDYARTYIGYSGRVATTMPILWTTGDPTQSNQWWVPPEQKTKGSLRLLRKVIPKTGSYKLTFGLTYPSQEIRTSILTFEELDIYSLQLPSLALFNTIVTAYAKLDISKLQDLSYFKASLNLIDRSTGVQLNNIKLLQAEQVESNIFKIIGQSNGQYDIDTTDKFRSVGDTNTFIGGGGSGSSSSSSTSIPSDTWQTSVDAQISGLTEKTSPVDADNFVIDDSADGNKKKRITWTRVKSILKTYFDTLYNNFSISKATGAEINTGTDDAMYVTPKAIKDSDIAFLSDIPTVPPALSKATGAEINTGTDDAKYVTPKAVADSNIFVRVKANQIKDTTEKTTIADDDRFLIDDSEAYYAKKSLKWSTIFTKLSGSFFGNVASQFSAITEKTGYAANDILIIEDSADGNKKKKYKFSTFMEKVLLMGFWEAVSTFGIKTLKTVGIGTAAVSDIRVKIHEEDNVAISVSASNANAINAGAGGWGINASGSAGGGRFSSGLQAASEHEVDLLDNPNEVATVIKLIRKARGNATHGIGGLIAFGLENEAGTVIYPAYIGARLTNATTGAAEIVFFLGSTVRAKITENFDFQLTEGNNIIPSNKAYYFGGKTTDGSWRMQISGSDLLMQRRIAGSWVTKNTITG